MSADSQGNMSNATTDIDATMSPMTTPNYWPDFGPLQYVEVVYLCIIVVLGTIGNLIVIFSIALERRVHLHGNIFIINLAVADLIVSGFIVPTVIANVLNSGNALSPVLCETVGFLVTATCTCSLSNLMFIALNRFWAVTKSGTYQKVFSRKRVYIMMMFTWIWSSAVSSPTLMNWGALKYDDKIMICSWDDEKAISYTFFITMIAIFIPLSIIGVCYFKLFSTVRGSGRWVRSLSTVSGISSNSDQHRRSMRKERSLLRTLLTTVLLFCVCWVPFGACVMINPGGTPAHAKKVFGWLAVTNSCVNFIIYGAMNPVFRRGYHNLFLFVFRCKRMQRLGSTAIHGSFSDSYNRHSNRATKGNHRTLNGRPRKSRSRSDTNRENSKADTITAMPPAVSTITQTTMHDNSPLLVRTQVKEQSPHTATQDSSLLMSVPDRVHVSTNSPNVKQKKGIVETLRRASLLRMGRLRSNTADSATSGEDSEGRAKRNCAMLLQLHAGDEKTASDGEELVRNHAKRFSRRAMSDISSGGDKRTRSELEKRQEKVCGNDEVAFNMGEISEGPLRRHWMPEKAVYTSRGNTPILEASSARRLQRTKNGEASSKDSPATRKGIRTASDEVDKRTDEKAAGCDPLDKENNELNNVPKHPGSSGENTNAEHSAGVTQTSVSEQEISSLFDDIFVKSLHAPHHLTSQDGAADLTAPTTNHKKSPAIEDAVQQTLSKGFVPELATRDNEEKR